MKLENTIKEFAYYKNKQNNITESSSKKCWEGIRNGIRKERHWYVRFHIGLRRIAYTFHFKLIMQAAIIVLIVICIPIVINKTTGLFNKSATEKVIQNRNEEKTPAGNDNGNMTATGDAEDKNKNITATSDAVKNVENALPPTNTDSKITYGSEIALNDKGKPVFPIQLSTKDSFMVEDEKYIYYSSKSGINKVNKQNGNTELILEKSNINYLSLDGEYLYFVDSSQEYPSINRIDKDGKNFRKLLEGKRIADINDDFSTSKVFDKIRVFGSKICISAAGLTGLYLYDLNSNELKLVTDDVENFVMTNSSIYYTHHAARDFTIYKADYKDLKSTILLGDGKEKTKESTNFYDSDNIIFIGNTLYFVTRAPNQLCKLENGKTSVISTLQNSSVTSVFEYRGELYYILYNADKATNTLYKYDSPKDKIIPLHDFQQVQVGINPVIMNGCLYYYDIKKDKKEILRLPD